MEFADGSIRKERTGRAARPAPVLVGIAGVPATGVCEAGWKRGGVRVLGEVPGMGLVVAGRLPLPHVTLLGGLHCAPEHGEPFAWSENECPMRTRGS